MLFSADHVFILAEQQVHAGALGLLAPEEFGKVGTPRRKHAARPIRDLRRRQPAWSAVDEKELDLLAIHARNVTGSPTTGFSIPQKSQSSSSVLTALPMT
ncbi:MAG: hypothetical protein QM662_16645 [Gordonia sp. (in: high G+C Gram-positive bacteria)]